MGWTNTWHLCTSKYIIQKEEGAPTMKDMYTRTSVARDYYVKGLLLCIEVFHFSFAKGSPFQGCLLWPADLNLYPANYSPFPSQPLPQLATIFFLTCLFSIFPTRLNAPWVHRSCLLCFHSISSPWCLGRSIILVRIGQALLW